MHKIVGLLTDGIKIGEVHHVEFEMQTIMGLEYMHCLADSEKVVQVPQPGFDENGWQNKKTELVPSPALMAINVMRERLLRIGDISPVSDEMFKMITPADVICILNKSDELDQALAEAAYQSGRLDPPDE